MYDEQNIPEENSREQFPISKQEEEKLPSDPGPDVTKPKSQTEYMEVHKHPHDVTHKKKSGEYLLEFFMLFLAVFLGFVAENIREHSTEKKKARELAGSLYEELNSDSINAQKKVAIRIQKNSVLNFLVYYIKDSNLTKPSENIYPAMFIGLFNTSAPLFEPKSGMLDQLKNSDSLSYFNDATLQKGIGDLTVTITNIRLRNEREYAYVHQYIRPFLIKHFDLQWLKNISYDNESSDVSTVINYGKRNAGLPNHIINLENFDLQGNQNIILYYQQMLRYTRQWQMQDYIKINHKLMQILRNNYHFNKE